MVQGLDLLAEKAARVGHDGVTCHRGRKEMTLDHRHSLCFNRVMFTV